MNTLIKNEVTICMGHASMRINFTAPEVHRLFSLSMPFQAIKLYNSLVHLKRVI